MEWKVRLRGWYAQAVADVKKNMRPDFSTFDFDHIKWEVTLRSSRKAGICYMSRKRIWLHGAMNAEQAHSTFLHELAHLFAYWHDDFYKGHGPTFKRWAQAMGDEGDRCHNYKEVMATCRGLWAHCPRCKGEFKKMFRSGIGNYYCKKCRVHLRPGKVSDVPTTVPVPIKAAARVEVKEVDTTSVRVLRDLLGLQADKNSKDARRIRRQLRRLGHKGGSRG